MENWSLDSHPILNKFRHLVNNIDIQPDHYYYLFLTPPYAHPIESNFNPLMYLFFATTSEPMILHQYPDPKVTFELIGNTISSLSGFNYKFTLNLLLSTPCTSGNSFSYMLEEIDDDLYRHVPPPPIMKKIHDSYREPKTAKMFLSDISDATLSENLKKVEHCFFTAEINESNRQNFTQILNDYTASIAKTVFNIQIFSKLPVAIKRELNFLIFNAITEQCHYQLLLAYNSSFSTENLIAQENTRNAKFNYPTKLKKEEMEEAVKHLHNILHLPSPAEMIDCIVKFFDLVVSALPGVEVAADDILPAICFAMSKDVGFGSHVVSFFNYLTDIWPAVGLDERITYILITCSIAASHLSAKQKKQEKGSTTLGGSVMVNGNNNRGDSDQAPNSSTNTAEMNSPTMQTEETIEMLEDLLNLM